MTKEEAQKMIDEIGEELIANIGIEGSNKVGPEVLIKAMFYHDVMISISPALRLISTGDIADSLRKIANALEKANLVASEIDREENKAN